MKTEHIFLVKAGSRRQAAEKICRFIKDYNLVSYDEVLPVKDSAIKGSATGFWKEANRGMEKNMDVIKGLFSLLSQEGYGRFEDLSDIPQGFLSKIFHTIAHLLDGFFGVDSYFFNLEEDSHWVSNRLKRAIEKNPDQYWIIKVLGITDSSEGFPFTA